LRVADATLFAAWILLAGLPCSGQQSTKQRPNIILISVDTLRADRVSAEATPNIDKLTHGGTSFTQETSMVPLTLPSHVSMLTSTYPFVSGVEDNGERLGPGAGTLAGTLRANGYQTAAFLGSFVLDRRFGLDQGFETYDSPVALLNSGGDAGDIKRKGQAVADAGEAWLSTHSDRPFFLFLHFYDLHTPYDLSAAEEAKFGKGYHGELSYIDHVIGGLRDYLAAHDLVNQSLIVFTSDHGEGLGDHGESTHGFFIYQSTLHVPLIIHWPAGATPMPERVDTPASLLDLSPTILDAVRIPTPQAMEGKSMLASGQPRNVFSESVYPQRHFGASALASLRQGHYKYIEAPRPEFYDLAKDPGESTNLYADKGSLASAYREKLKQLRQLYEPRSRPTANTLSPEVIDLLHALGYLVGSNSARSSAANGVDPKDRIGDYEEYGKAIYLASLGQMEEADTILKDILMRDRDLSDVRLALGLNEQRMGRDAEALDDFRTVLVAEPASAIAHLDAGLSYYNLRQYEKSEQELNAALAISPGYTKAEVVLARTLGQEHKYDQAAAEFNQVLKETPDSYDAHDGLGTLAAMRGDWSESEKQLQAALSIEPAAAETHNTLGNVYLRQGETAQARGQFEEAVRLKPEYAAAHYGLGLTLVALKNPIGAKSEFEKALSADPNYLPARNALAQFSKSP
jgi:choline-sulfatase